MRHEFKIHCPLHEILEFYWIYQFGYEFYWAYISLDFFVWILYFNRMPNVLISSQLYKLWQFFNRMVTRGWNIHQPTVLSKHFSWVSIIVLQNIICLKEIQGNIAFIRCWSLNGDHFHQCSVKFKMW